jgi:hypothetical protein
MKVERIEPKESYEWLLKKHYAKRIPSISWCCGLFIDNNLVGVCTIGKPASNSLCIGVCGKEYSSIVYELNRLVVHSGLPKNTLSFFVSKVLKSFKDDIILVSYADSKLGHHGYIYQATNWIYTGATKERTDIGTGESHSRHYDKNLDYKENRKHRSSKHRYVYFVGKNKNKISSKLKYAIEPYPKGENKRYDSSYMPTIQQRLL